jgi:hypothetical protein
MSTSQKLAANGLGQRSEFDSILARISAISDPSTVHR